MNQQREKDLKRQFEENAQILLNEQAKRERANYLEDLKRMQEEAKSQTKLIAKEAIVAKNKNDKLNKQVLDKEQYVLDLQNKLTLSEADSKHL